MDGKLVGTYQHIPTTSVDYQYNVPVYVNTSLSNQQHVLTMEATGTNASLILFDYADYTCALVSPSNTFRGLTNTSRLQV